MNTISLNAASAWNLRFLDREGEILYPWRRKSQPAGKVVPGNDKEQMIWVAS